MDRDEVGRKVMETSQAVAEGYTRAISEQFQTEPEQDANRKCSIAASNTGYFILQALGFTKPEIQALADACRRT